MPRLAHIVHPGIVPPTSDLRVAQPVTFETMRIAQAFAPEIPIELFAVQSHDEDRVALPPSFIRTPDLHRSLSDLQPFAQSRKLALIADILETLNQVSRADYFIYTNVDIGVQPFFYRTVAAFIASGYDCFIINRRTIPDRFRTIEQLPQMWAEIGESHPGYDCFVFRRDYFPAFLLGTICLGTAWIGRALLANLVATGGRFREFRNEQLTFHIGDQRPWRQEQLGDYFRHNQEEYRVILGQLEARLGGFDPQIRSYLADSGDQRWLPGGDIIAGRPVPGPETPV
jgi:hypothetical protein